VYNCLSINEGVLSRAVDLDVRGASLPEPCHECSWDGRPDRGKGSGSVRRCSDKVLTTLDASKSTEVDEASEYSERGEDIVKIIVRGGD
jgi:hypothetical protein